MSHKTIISIEAEETLSKSIASELDVEDPNNAEELIEKATEKEENTESNNEES